MLRNNVSIHAEIDAIAKIRFDKRYDLIVIRIDRHGNIRNSKPCKYCLLQLNKLVRKQLRYIYYSQDDGSCKVNTLSELLAGEQHVTRRYC